MKEKVDKKACQGQKEPTGAADKPLAQIPGTLMKVLTNRHTGSSLMVLHLHVLQKLICDKFQCVIRPGLEPVDRAAVDERGKLAEAVAEGVTNGTHGEDDVEVFTATVDKEVEQGERSEFRIFVLGLGKGSHGLWSSIHLRG